MRATQHSEGIEIFLNMARNTAITLGKLGAVEAARETFEDGLRVGHASRRAEADVRGAEVAPIDTRYRRQIP